MLCNPSCAEMLSYGFGHCMYLVRSSQSDPLYRRISGSCLVCTPSFMCERVGVVRLGPHSPVSFVDHSYLSGSCVSVCR